MNTKRINNELIKFSEIVKMKYNIDAECYEFKLCDSSNIRRVGIFLNKNMIMRLDITKDYPFKPPNVYVANSNNLLEKYNEWSAQILSNRKDQLFVDYSLAWAFSIITNPKLAVGWDFIPTNNCIKCLCCESVTCGNNWFACCRFPNIFIEYLSRRYFVNNCSKLRQRLIRRIFNNDNWSLPDEIILYIAEIVIANSPCRFKLVS